MTLAPFDSAGYPVRDERDATAPEPEPPPLPAINGELASAAIELKTTVDRFFQVFGRAEELLRLYRAELMDTEIEAAQEARRKLYYSVSEQVRTTRTQGIKAQAYAEQCAREREALAVDAEAKPAD